MAIVADRLQVQEESQEKAHQYGKALHWQA